MSKKIELMCLLPSCSASARGGVCQHHGRGDGEGQGKVGQRGASEGEMRRRGCWRRTLQGRGAGPTGRRARGEPNISCLWTLPYTPYICVTMPRMLAGCPEKHRGGRGLDKGMDFGKTGSKIFFRPPPDYKGGGTTPGQAQKRTVILPDVRYSRLKSGLNGEHWDGGENEEDEYIAS